MEELSTIDTGDIPVAAAVFKFYNIGGNKHVQNTFQISNIIASVIMKTCSIFPEYTDVLGICIYVTDTDLDLNSLKHI